MASGLGKSTGQAEGGLPINYIEIAQYIQEQAAGDACASLHDAVKRHYARI